MDELYKHGLNDIFIEVVLSVIKKFKIETKYSHLDATSFPLDGEYKSEEKKEKEEELLKERRFFGLSYAMDGGYKVCNPYIERHLAIFVNFFLI